MEYKINTLPKSQIEISVIVPFPEFEPHVKRAASVISEKTDIEGFRKGKAPYDIVKQRVGEAAIYDEAAEIAARHTYPEIMRLILLEKEAAGEQFMPIAAPEVAITKLAPGNELQYKATVSLLPRVDLPDYKEIARRAREKEKKEVSVSDEELNKTIEWLCESRAQTVLVNRPASQGDVVELDIDIRKGGVKIEEGELRNHSFILGRGKFIPGFEDEAVGMEKGSVKEFTLPVPEDWREKSLAGSMLDIRVAMKSVSERTIPVLDDTFAKRLGAFDSADALKSRVRDGIRAEKEEKERQRVRMLIAEEIADGAQIDVPDALAAAEGKKMIDELRHGVEEMGMTWVNYLLHIKKTVDVLKEEFRPDAFKRVRIALTLREIAKKEDLEPGNAEVEEKTNEYIRQVSTAQDATSRIDPEQLKTYTKGVLRNEKVFAFFESV